VLKPSAGVRPSPLSRPLAVPIIRRRATAPLHRAPINQPALLEEDNRDHQGRVSQATNLTFLPGFNMETAQPCEGHWGRRISLKCLRVLFKSVEVHQRLRPVVVTRHTTFGVLLVRRVPSRYESVQGRHHQER
jgi:hypothetical protein